jgi:FixJ family two-component response regulator
MGSIGYRAECFISAGAFLTSPSLLNTNCIIADVHMPGMSGLALVRELRRRHVTTPVILITALPDKYLDEEANSAGALCLLRKPFEINSLLDSVEKGLQQSDEHPRA